jgi:hypothetical protein
MKTKTAVLSSLGVVLAALVLSVVLLVGFVNPNSRRAAERAALLGQGVGLLCLIPLGGIWLLWAARVRKEREAARKLP